NWPVTFGSPSRRSSSSPTRPRTTFTVVVVLTPPPAPAAAATRAPHRPRSPSPSRSRAHPPRPRPPPPPAAPPTAAAGPARAARRAGGADPPQRDVGALADLQRADLIGPAEAARAVPGRERERVAARQRGRPEPRAAHQQRLLQLQLQHAGLVRRGAVDAES